MTSAISLQQISKTYRKSILSPACRAVLDLSLEVEPGEVFGFIGPNGAGKSTTIKILTGILKPTSGAAFLFGISAEHPQARQGIGYVPESPGLYDMLTPLEVLEMGLALHGVKLPDVRRHCLEWLSRFDLLEVANKRLRSFSKGMLQRTALAHALAIQPRLLILDEPLSGLDPVGRREVVNILLEYKCGGGSIFLTSHVLHDVERLADRFGLIHQGALKAVRSPSELVGRSDRVVVRSLGMDEVAGMRSDTQGRWQADVPRQELWPLLAALREAHHDIIEIKPALDLESAFFSAIEKPLSWQHLGGNDRA